MKITLLYLAACLIACGQGSKSHDNSVWNELLEKINQNLENQNQLLQQIYTHSYHQQNSLNQSLSLVEKNIENTKDIVQEIGNTKTKSNEAVNTVELLNNYTKNISNWQENFAQNFSNWQKNFTQNISNWHENFVQNISNWRDEASKKREHFSSNISNWRDEASKKMENFTPNISNGQENFSSNISNGQENFTPNISNLQNNTIKTVDERPGRFLSYPNNKTTEIVGQDLTHYPTSCKEVKGTESGLYYIRITAVSEEPFQVFCDQNFENGGWTVIQRRVDNSTDFYLNWHEYQTGFGDLSRNFWIGLDKLHLMTNDKSYTLAIILEDYDGNRRHAEYDRFVVGSESEYYSLKFLGDYTGSAGDSLSDSKGMRFSTYDKDNDNASYNCAVADKTGWWFNNCGYSNLNGEYLGKNRYDYTGIYWYGMKNNYECLKFSQMMIRRAS